MSPWVLRGLRDGVVTTRWPGRPDPYADRWRGPATVADPRPAEVAGLASVCPTGAITTAADGSVRLDQGRCILCGRCVDQRSDGFGWSRGPAAGALTRAGLVVPQTSETEQGLAAIRAGLAARTAALRRAGHLRAGDGGPGGPEGLAAIRAGLAARTAALRRSVHLRHVDTGSDGAEEQELAALLNPVYDIHRLGVFFPPS